MRRYIKTGIWGFLFGAVGLYILAMLSLISQIFEVIFSPLFLPGRTVSELLVGPEGSNVAVALLTLFNGIFYALVFVLIAWLIRLFSRR